MTSDEKQDAIEILAGYDRWRRQRISEIENGSDDQLSISAYIDALSHQRNADAVTEIRNAFQAGHMNWEEFGKHTASILGLA